MAKKTRRARGGRQVTEPVRGVPKRPTLKAEAPAAESDFRVEYHYVVEDLKRIAIIAFALLVLVVVLALVIG
ncbi:MAG TPA: hypothetical protein VLC95_20490 [Anaerolineae bacterium]|jgi:hypothetical protein|nr:hypothetical protein [Anaerolineae bacterium]